jgi:positive regulator of sigma E activity
MCESCMNRECKARQGRNLEPGQLVETETGDSAAVIQAVPALLIPALGFIAGFFLTALAFPGSGEPARSASGVFLMGIAALGFYLYRRLSKI